MARAEECRGSAFVAGTSLSGAVCWFVFVLKLPSNELVRATLTILAFQPLTFGGRLHRLVRRRPPMQEFFSSLRAENPQTRSDPYDRGNPRRSHRRSAPGRPWPLSDREQSDRLYPGLAMPHSRCCRCKEQTALLVLS